MAWAKAKMGRSLALYCGGAASGACSVETDCLGFARDMVLEPRGRLVTELLSIAHSLTRTPWRSEEADILPNKLPLPLPLRGPIISLSRDRKVVGASHCLLLLNDECMAKAWVGRTWPTPRRVGFGDWQLGLPLPTMCGLPTQVWHISPSQKAQFAPEGRKPKDMATFPPGCVISSKSLNLSRSQFPSL